MQPAAGAEKMNRYGFFGQIILKNGKIEVILQKRRKIGRVTECAGLEIRYTGNRIGGLNPSSSAIYKNFFSLNHL